MGTIIDGIIIGGGGGLTAGVTLWGLQVIREKCVEQSHKKLIYKWMQKNAGQNNINFRSTRAIASSSNLTQDRVRIFVASKTKSD